MEGAPWRGRNRLVSGTAETRAQQPAGHREPLFLGSEPWGPGHTRPEQDLAQLLCRAQGQHPAILGSCRVLPLTGRTGKEKEEKKSWEMAPASPSLTAVQSATHTQHWYLPLHLHLPGQVKLPWGLRVSVLGRRSCSFPSPTHPAAMVMCRVLCDPPRQGVPAMGSWVTGKCVEQARSTTRDALTCQEPQHVTVVMGPPTGHPDSPGPFCSNPSLVRA